MTDQLGPDQLGSISGVIIATTIIVETVKKLVGKHRWFRRLPIFVYVVIVSLVLTAFANLCLHSLEGRLPHLMWETFYSALAASGFYSWLRDSTK